MKFLLSVCVVTTLVAVAGCGMEGPSNESMSEEALRAGCRWDCPRCRPGQVCSRRACVLRCPPSVTPCGANVCRNGDYCCNASCGTCAPAGSFCTQQACEPTPPPAPRCASDADCRLFSDYCTGCDCRALNVRDADPTCSGPGVRCFADPCLSHSATCNTTTGQCQLN